MTNFKGEMEPSILIQRKLSKENPVEERTIKKEDRTLTLAEEVFLLGLNDTKGWTSFWNTNLSGALRGCLLVELGFLDRIELEPSCTMRKKLSRRHVLVKDSSSTNDPLLDEVLKHIKDSVPASIQNWLEYLNGESWNPMKLKYSMNYVRHRLAKNLVEKGILRTEKQNYFVFDIITHPLVDHSGKANMMKKILEGLYEKWTNDLQRMDPRVLALIILAHIADVLEDCFNSLSDDVYDIVSKRAEELVAVNFDSESKKGYVTNMLWGVAYCFLK